MTALTSLARTETRLFLREPVTVAIAVLLPDVFGGLAGTAYFAPVLLVISIAQLGLQTLPGRLAGYRERGILRRFSTTPMSPVAVLCVQLLVHVLTALVGTLLCRSGSGRSGAVARLRRRGSGCG